MSIKINGITIIDEKDFANKDLSNLSSSGEQVINNYVTMAISGLNYMKTIDTTSGISFTLKYNTTNSYTTPSDGWIYIYLVVIYNILDLIMYN